MRLAMWTYPWDVLDVGLDEVARELKRKFGAGGTTKGKELMLQGDHRAHLKDELVKLGFPGDHIDTI